MLVASQANDKLGIANTMEKLNSATQRLTIVL